MYIIVIHERTTSYQYNQQRCVEDIVRIQLKDPFSAKLDKLNFRSREVVSRYREPQLQVG